MCLQSKKMTRVYGSEDLFLLNGQVVIQLQLKCPPVMGHANRSMLSFLQHHIFGKNATVVNRKTTA